MKSADESIQILVAAVKARHAARGNAQVDSTAFTLRYLQSYFAEVLKELPKTRQTSILKEMEVLTKTIQKSVVFKQHYR